MSSFSDPYSYQTMPAVHGFRHLPLSPPDTDHDLSHVSPVALSGNSAADLDMTPATGHYLAASLERTRYQPRRPSTLSYQSSGAGDPRDRGYPRSPKNLVVVIPPADLPLDQGHLGNVLSMGPHYRLSQGILMPLFPSMFGQLNAIAREYNFPSTVGLCLYLHVNENGVKMTPRISDDSWQYLFGHLFEGRQSSSQQLPIGGSIEFDIDLNKARWFDAWVAGTLRDSDPAFPSVINSQASFGAHWRGESQTTNTDEQQVEDRWDASASRTLVTNSRSETLRHPPRKLSLVDRLDSHGFHVPLKSQNNPDPDPDSPTHALLPIPQSAVPQAAKCDLEHRVSSWREITELYPASMTETYQPVPDIEVSVGVTAMDEYALERNSLKGANNNEYLSSLASAGLHSLAVASSVTSSQPFSVHLDHRANGDISLTPITATSWGPADDEWDSVVSNVSRLPSPDAGKRMAGYTARRQCAVWGNSFGWRYAVTWKEVYPYSVTQTKLTIQVLLQDSNGFVPQYPNLVIYPTVGSHPDTHSLFNTFKHINSSPRLVWGGSFGWQRAVTWRKVYPYSTVTMQPISPIQFRGAGGLVFKYPNLCIYPAVYPNFEIYPACTIEEGISQSVFGIDESSNLTMSYPSLATYPAVYPHLDIYAPLVEGARMKGSTPVDTYSLDGVSTSYPNLVLYPAIYPYFDLYPKALQITEPLKQMEVDVRLVNVGCLTAEYPNMTIYPNAYPYLEVYPARDTGTPASSVVWGISFGWLTAKTWLQVYPLHTAHLEARRRVEDQSRSISRSWSPSPASAGTVVRKQAVWGRSFGWESAVTWRAVWPTHARIHSNVSPIFVQPGQQSDPSSTYPYLIIYPVAYPHFDIYPPRAPVVEAEESQPTKENQCTVNLIPHYPNLAIYPAVYPHLDVYSPFAKDSAASEREKGQSNLRRRRIEVWRAKTAAQVGLAELLANNHIWEVDEPLQLDLADYAWSRSSAGPPTPPLELPHTPSAPGSIHIDRRIQESVLLTPSTATTWGPQDDDWYSDISSIERLPSPDLGQRLLEDVDDNEFPHRPWHIVWPFFGRASQMKNLPLVLERSGSVLEYPYLMIYPPAYPHFELYPAWANKSTSKDRAAETLASSNTYPTLDIYPAVYPHFNIYPAVLRVEISSRLVSNVWYERVEVRLPSLYPDLDIYHACYPYNLDHIYPFINTLESTQVPIEVSRGYPWLVVYPPVYPFIIPYPGSSAEITQPFKPEQSPSIFSPIEWKSVNVKLSAQYPILDLCYPWSLEFIYPAGLVDDYSEVVKPQYPCIWIYPAVYPFVEPYPGISGSVHVPGALDEGEYASARAFLAFSELKRLDSEHAVYPYFYPTAPMVAPQAEHVVQDAYVNNLATPVPHMPVITRRNRKTHTELHASVFQSLGKRPARDSKAHAQLHIEVFQDGIVWTPSGCIQEQAVQEVDVRGLTTSHLITQKKRRTHMELRASVLRSLGKRPARNSKTHTQLHSEVFQNGIVWTPSGYVQDISSLTRKKPGDIPVRESRRRPSQDNSIPRLSRSRPGINTAQSSSDMVAFPLVQPPPLSPISSLRVRSPGTSSQPPSVVSEAPMPRIPLPSIADRHKRTASSRLTQAIKSLVPGLQRRYSSAAPESPPPKDNKERGKDRRSPAKFLSLVDRRSRAVSPLPYTNTSEFLTRAPPSSQRKESLVLQRARAYEQATVANQSSSAVGIKGTRAPFTLPPLPQLPPMTDVAEAIEKPKNTFP